MRAPEARHIVSHLFSECNAHRFQHKRTAENDPNTNEGTSMGVHSWHLPAPEHLCTCCWRDGRPYSFVTTISSYPPNCGCDQGYQIELVGVDVRRDRHIRMATRIRRIRSEQVEHCG